MSDFLSTLLTSVPQSHVLLNAQSMKNPLTPMRCGLFPNLVHRMLHKLALHVLILISALQNSVRCLVASQKRHNNRMPH